MLRKSGSSGDKKEKFPWNDELDAILGTQPTSSPQTIVESIEEEKPQTPSSLALSDSESTQQDQESEKRAGKWVTILMIMFEITNAILTLNSIIK